MMKDIEEPPIKEEEPISDAFDLLQYLGAKVHWPKQKRFNRDHLLSNCTDRERLFIREQTRLIDLMKKYPCDEEAKIRMQEILSIDLQSVVIMSRSRNAKILNALVDAVTGKGKETNTTDSAEKPGFFSRLFTKSKPPQ